MVVSPVSQAPRLVGVGLKMYLDHHQTLAWLDEVNGVIAEHPAVQDGRVGLFVLPSFTALADTRRILQSTPIEWGAQDVSWAASGPFTGEVAAAELAQLGCSFVEVGHAERKRLFAEDAAVVAAKLAAAHRGGLLPVLCIGEAERLSDGEAITECIRQLEVGIAATEGARSGVPLVVAYEPEWAIGAAEPASTEHVQTIALAMKAYLATDERLRGSRLIYGGSAGTGMLGSIGDAIDGLFLGRSAHDVHTLRAVIDEAAS